MGLIRSLLVRLGMESANFDAGAKKAQNSLYGLTSSMAKTQQMFSSFGRTAIMLRVSAAGIEGFTAWLRVAEEGGTQMEILKAGLYGFTQGIPFVGRLVRAFKELKDEITGARIQQELLKASMEFKERKIEIEAKIKSIYGESNADKHYRENIKAINAANPIAVKEGLGLSAVTSNVMAIKTAGVINRLIRDAMELRKWERGKKGIEELSDALEMFYTDTRNATDIMNQEIQERIELKRQTEESIKSLQGLSDSLALFYGEEFEDKIHREMLVADEATASRHKREGEYTRMQNPEAIEARPAYVDIKALTASRQDILVKKQEESIVVQKQMRDRLMVMGSGSN